MNNRKLCRIALSATFLSTGAMGDTRYDDPSAILAELVGLSEECASIDDGQSQTEVFGIKLIRVGGTCAIVNGGELDERVRVFLEKENLDWAGVGLWVSASGASE